MIAIVHVDTERKSVYGCFPNAKVGPNYAKVSPVLLYLKLEAQCTKAVQGAWPGNHGGLQS